MSQSIIYKDRLLKLAAFLRTVPEERFDMRHWISRWDGEHHDLSPSCGTAACALGWAAAIPEFRQAGLSVRGQLHYGPPVRYKDSDPLTPPYYFGMVTYNGYHSETAGAEFFGLDYAEAKRLFMENFEATPAQKAKEIEKLVAKKFKGAK